MNANLDYDKIYEIRLRVGRPLFYTYDGGEGFLTDHDGKYVVTREDLKETMEYISGYSLYSYEDEMRQGFLTVQGGHRVGVTGKVILDGNEIQGMKYISCINVRLAHAEVGEHAAQCGIDVCICTGPLSANIAKMARKNPELIVIEEPDRDSLLSHLSDYVQTGDTILVKASHFMQFEKVVAALQEM